MATNSDSTNRASAQSKTPSTLQPTPRHTPAPWDCDVAGQPIIVNGPEDNQGRNVICTIEDADCMHGKYQYPSEVAAANARLIAVAPEMLALLNRAVSLLEKLGDFIGNGEIEKDREGSLGERCDLILDIQKVLSPIEIRGES